MRDEIRERSFSARADCHYLVRGVDAPSALVVALHGFGQTAEVMMSLTEGMVGERCVIASIEGPNQFFLEGHPRATVGFCWGGNRYAASSIRLHHEMVQHVLDEVGGEFGIPPGLRVLMGYSQSVSYNYRFAATAPQAVGGVVGICGGMPSDWETGEYRAVEAAVLHIARREDEFYPPAVTEKYEARLRTRARDVEVHLMDGGHRFPSRGDEIFARWLERLLAAKGIDGAEARSNAGGDPGGR